MHPHDLTFSFHDASTRNCRFRAKLSPSSSDPSAPRIYNHIKSHQRRLEHLHQKSWELAWNFKHHIVSMKISFACSAIALSSSFLLSLAAPINDLEQSVLAEPARDNARQNPYKPGYEDPNDHKVDSVGDGLQPKPWRNGHGASILGPQNRDRQRQNPDMMRPPSTDHGDMKNMRWSFADSHTRIEVRRALQLM